MPVNVAAFQAILAGQVVRTGQDSIPPSVAGWWQQYPLVARAMTQHTMLPNARYCKPIGSSRVNSRFILPQDKRMAPVIDGYQLQFIVLDNGPFLCKPEL